MIEKRTYYQLTVRQFYGDFNRTTIYTFNSPELAYEKYANTRAKYYKMSDFDRMSVSVELHAIDRSPEGVNQLTILSLCGYNIADCYSEDINRFNDMVARYCSKPLD